MVVGTSQPGSPEHRRRCVCFLLQRPRRDRDQSPTVPLHTWRHNMQSGHFHSRHPVLSCREKIPTRAAACPGRPYGDARADAQTAARRGPSHRLELRCADVRRRHGDSHHSGTAHELGDADVDGVEQGRAAPAPPAPPMRRARQVVAAVEATRGNDGSRAARRWNVYVWPPTVNVERVPKLFDMSRVLSGFSHRSLCAGRGERPLW